ncbi:hypothetical protein RTBOTA2_005551 [Rhodotorula toruloides]|uniref:Uncharacterized protein n=1 Tax=Rhodotorula toruloides TaxID=5286 RepID=A0A0K3CJ81_RHOTO|nr:hypothetical protein RTBOTA2_005551 [Rhodotorula toruloides]
MVATSPSATTSSTSNPQRPPVRNKSSSALSTQTIRTLSSTSSGKPRRNRSFTGLAGGGGVHHGHPAGHHAVSFAHHRKNSHSAHAMKRSGSASGSARKSSFGLGMTSMEGGGAGEDEQGERDGRPQRPSLATSRSSSSSTVTAVGGGSRDRLEHGQSDRGRSRSRSRARVEAEQIQQDQADDQRQRLEINTKAKAKERLTGSVTSGSDWESATDSPLAIGRKLPDVARSVAPEGQSALAQGFSQQDDGEEEHDERAVEESPKSGEGRVTAQDEERAPAPQRVEVSAAPSEEQGLPPRPTGKKPKFQLGASEDQEDDESLRAEAQADGASTPRQEKSQAEAEAHATEEAVQAVTPPVEGIQPEHIAQAQLAQTDEDVVPDSGGADSIPPSAMPPAATAILPSLPAMIQAAAPTEPLDAPLRPDADEEQQAAALAAPAPPSAPQHLSPPDSSPLGGPAAEPSLAAAAQPELAFPNGPPSGPPSRPESAGGRTRGGGSAEPLRTPAPPTPTSEEEEAHLPAEAEKKDRKEKAKHVERNTDDVSPIRPLPQRAPPTRKASNTSIVSAASTRSALHRGPAPQFRRTASGIAPVLVDRGATARAELASPGPESPNGGGELRRSVTGERSATAGRHQRTESMSSIRSLRQAAEATTSGSHRTGPGETRRLRPTETAGGAIAALGTIAAAAGRTPPPSHDSSFVREGALTHAKRSASGYFNALRGFTGLPTASSPSTPPPSSSAGAAQQYPIPGAQGQVPTASSSLGRRSRSSDSPKPPPLVVKFVDAPPPPAPAMQTSKSQQGTDTPSTQPSTSPSQSQAQVPPRLSAKHRNASTTSLGPISRTQQKALLARDAPHVGSGRGGAGTPTTEAGAGATLAPPPVQGAQAMTPAQQQFLALQQQRALNASASSTNSASASASPAPSSAPHGMQKWAIGLVREAERIERQYRAVEKWRDPVGESLERVLVVRMRARRRREDDRERVRRAVEGLQGSQGQGLGEGQPKPRRAATTST